MTIRFQVLHCRREGENKMSLEAIEKVTQLEQQSQERKAAAEAEARRIVAEAEREGLALLQQTRAAAADKARKLLREAEERAAEKAVILHHNLFQQLRRNEPEPL